MLLPMIQSKESPSPPSKAPIDFDDEPSGPYIPISECYTGKPVSFKGYPNSNHHPPPPLPSSSSSSTLHHPTHHHQLAYKLPSSPGVHHHHNNNHNNNHNHHHHSPSTNYDVPRSSVFTKVALPINSPSASISSSATNSLSGRKSKPHNLTMGPMTQTLGRFDRLSDHSLRTRIVKPSVSDFPHQNYRNEPPPRPPKPKKLNNRSKSESCSPAAHLPANDHLTPSTSLNSHLDLPVSPGQFNPIISPNNLHPNTSSVSTSPSAISNSITNNNNQHKVNTPTSQPLTLDDVYDFPKSEPVSSSSSSSFNSLRTAIPAPGTRKGNSHSYTNAPPGHLTKPPVFTYDYKGSLPVYLDDNTIAYDLDNDRSPSTPNSAFDSLSSNGSLTKSLTPPAVNRDLKPKRRDSDSDNVSPTSPTFTLAPPPAHSKAYSNQINGKPPTRHLPDVSAPRVPSRGRQFQHHVARDDANSDEDVIRHSRIFHKRNSSLDDQPRRGPTMMRKTPNESPDVTYLDLDLQEKSDKTPSNSSDPKSLSNQKDLSDASNLSGSQSTVYKSIDFVATQAFRQLRISSQRCIEKD